jgi:hypothetical protein
MADAGRAVNEELEVGRGVGEEGAVIGIGEGTG